MLWSLPLPWNGKSPAARTPIVISSSRTGR
jgi:hypothetical protein